METSKQTKRITNMDCLGFSIYTAAAIAGGLAVAIVMYGLADQLIKILAAI